MVVYRLGDLYRPLAFFETSKLRRDRPEKRVLNLAVAGLGIFLRTQYLIALIERFEGFVLLVSPPIFAGKAKQRRRDLRFVPNSVERTVGEVNAPCPHQPLCDGGKQRIAMDVVELLGKNAGTFKRLDRLVAPFCVDESIADIGQHADPLFLVLDLKPERRRGFQVLGRLKVVIFREPHCRHRHQCGG